MVYSYTTTMYRLTATYEIWDDDDGDTHLEVGEDAEGLDQVEIREYIHGDEEDPDEVLVIGCSPEQALLLIGAIETFVAKGEPVTIPDEESGYRIELGHPLPEEGPEDAEPSDDDLVEIRQYNETGEEMGVICCALPQLPYVASAIHRYLKAREFLVANPTGMVKPNSSMN